MSLLHEWPLVLFTLTVQLAVGFHLALLAVGELSPRGHAVEPGRRRVRRASLMVGMLMTAALTISLLHLGTPLNAIHTLANLDDSWLSREILAALVFLGLWGMGFWLEEHPGRSPWAGRAAAWGAGVAGIILIWVMARIYMVPARPLWDHWLTGAGFLLTAILLGGAAGAVVLRAPLEPGGNTGRVLATPVIPLLAAGLAAALAQVGVTLVHPLTLELLGSPGEGSMAIFRLLLLLAGSFFLMVPLFRRVPRDLSGAGIRPGSSVRWAVAALALLGASELLGRMLFYSVAMSIPF